MLFHCLRRIKWQLRNDTVLGAKAVDDIVEVFCIGGVAFVSITEDSLVLLPGAGEVLIQFFVEVFPLPVAACPNVNWLASFTAPSRIDGWPRQLQRSSP